MTRMYEIKSGKYKGMWHVRDWSDGKLTHIGRYKSKEAAEAAAEIFSGETYIPVTMSITQEKTDWDSLIKAQKLKMQTIWK